MRILAFIHATKHSRSNIQIKSFPKKIQIKNCRNIHFFNNQARKLAMPILRNDLNFIFRILELYNFSKQNGLSSLSIINTQTKQKSMIIRAQDNGANHNYNKVYLLIILLLLLFAYFYGHVNSYVEYDKDLKIKIHHSLLHLFNGNVDKFISEIIHLSKEYDEIKNLLLYLESGQIYEANKILDNLFLYKLKMPDAYNLLKGIIYNSLGNYANAIKHLNNVLKSDSLYMRSCAYYHLSISYKAQNKYRDISEYVTLLNFNQNQIKNTQILYQKLSMILKAYPNKINHTMTFWDTIFYRSSSGLDYSNLSNLSDNGNIIIRIWLPTSTNETGHVSVQTDKHYISFWPIGNKITSDLMTNIIIESHIGRFAKHNTLWEDIKDENRLPDVRLPLNLDTKAINEAYEDFVKSKYQWSLLGSMLTKSQNCSGLAYYLLLKGGLQIDKEILLNFDTKEGFIATNVAVAANIADLWGPIVAYPVKLIPYVGIPLSHLLQYAPKLTTGAIGMGGLMVYKKAITPENINFIVTAAFIRQRIKSNIENTLEQQDFIIKKSLQSGFA